MKTNIILSAMVIALSGTAVSCSDFLDKEVDLTQQKDNVFADYDNTRGFLANLYTYLPDVFYGFADNDTRNASFDCATDNATGYWSSLTYNAIHDDTYDAKTHWWANYYYTNRTAGIRACNQFLANARVDVIGNSEQVGDENRLGDRWIAEARAIRAILTFDMACWFGPSPIFVTENGDPYIMNTNDKMPDRSSFVDVVDWVVSECDAVKDALPFRYSNEDANWGRINGAAVLSLKSRALLYKASPQFNTQNSTAWWQAAADAAEEFMSRNNAQGAQAYKLYTTGNPDKDYYDCFTSVNPVYHPEYIFSRSVWSTRNIELFSTPCGFSGTEVSVGRTNPTQNFVDCYEVLNNGQWYTVDDPASGYDDQNPYVNRDPRMEQTVFHHGTIWGDANQEERRPVDVSLTGLDYGTLHGGTTTGYYMKKFVNEMSFNSPKNFDHACPIFRYAEILLNAAEAWNEAGDQQKAMTYVNEVRARAGMPAYSGLSQSKLRERIRNERRIELAFENHRYADVRRWKLYEESGHETAAAERNLPRWQQVRNVYGILPDVAPNADGTFSGSYTYRADIKHPQVVFTAPKSYYFPIPDDEIKAVTNWKQNSGWELSSKSNEPENDEGNAVEETEDE